MIQGKVGNDEGTEDIDDGGVDDCCGRVEVAVAIMISTRAKWEYSGKNEAGATHICGLVPVKSNTADPSSPLIVNFRRICVPSSNQSTASKGSPPNFL